MSSLLPSLKNTYKAYYTIYISRLYKTKQSGIILYIGKRRILFVLWCYYTIYTITHHKTNLLYYIQPRASASFILYIHSGASHLVLNKSAGILGVSFYYTILSFDTYIYINALILYICLYTIYTRTVLLYTIYINPAHLSVSFYYIYNITIYNLIRPSSKKPRASAGFFVLYSH